LVDKLASKNFHLSSSALLRHFRHVRPDWQFESIDTEDDTVQDIPTLFDGLGDDKISESAVAEVVVKALIEQLRYSEKAWRTTRDRAHAERLQARSLQQLAALDRALHRFDQIKQPRRELKQKFMELVQRVVEATQRASQAVLQDYFAVVNDALSEHLADPSRPDRLVRRVREFERDWPERLAERVLPAIRPIGEEAIATLR